MKQKRLAAGPLLERVYTTPASVLTIVVFCFIRTMAATRAATRAALQQVGGREHQVWALKVVVFGLECRRRFCLGRWVAFHVPILSPCGYSREALHPMGRIES